MPFLCNSRRIQLISIILVVSVILTVGTILLIFRWPSFARQQIIDNVVFKNGTLGLERFKTTADLKNLRISISVFNITNVDQVIKSAAKFKLEEIGPFVYHEYKHKEILTNDQDKGLITYKLRRRFTFRPEQSVGDPKAMNLTWINVPVISAMAFIEKLGLVARGIGRVALDTAIMTNKEPAFITDTVDSLIFTGSFRKMFAALEPALKPFIKKWPMPDNRFAILYKKNDSWLPDRDYIFTTAAGFGVNQTYRDLNQYKLMNGSASLPFWAPNTQCSKLRGSDGEFFSPFVNTSEKLDVYSMDICRKLSLKYRRNVMIQGIPVNEYTLDKRDLQSPQGNPENSCYCLAKDLTQCSLDGLMDLSKCVADDVYASMAHFLYGSPQLHDRLNGLRAADETLDEPIMHVEPNTGLSIQVKVPIQFNIRLTQNPSYKIFQFFKDLQPLIIPLVTVTEAAELDPGQATQLRTKLLLLDTWFIVMVLGGAVIFLAVFVTLIAILCKRYRTPRRREATERDPLLPAVYSPNDRRQSHE